ncbi:MAG: hypothetical protein ACRDHW_08950, partial [Ktedonobacteraceae bacterium]
GHAAGSNMLADLVASADQPTIKLIQHMRRLPGKTLSVRAKYIIPGLPESSIAPCVSCHAPFAQLVQTGRTSPSTPPVVTWIGLPWVV